MAGHNVATCAKNMLWGGAGGRCVKVTFGQAAHSGKECYIDLPPCQGIGLTVCIRSLRVSLQFSFNSLLFCRNWCGAGVGLFEKTTQCHHLLQRQQLLPQLLLLWLLPVLPHGSGFYGASLLTLHSLGLESKVMPCPRDHQWSRHHISHLNIQWRCLDVFGKLGVIIVKL